MPLGHMGSLLDIQSQAFGSIRRTLEHNAVEDYLEESVLE